MKPTTLSLAAILLALIPISSFAQMDERPPGIYSVFNGQSTALPYSYSARASSGFSVNNTSVGFSIYRYKGVSSGVMADSTFVLVIDPDKAVGVVTPWKFNCFIKYMTPDDVLILPLEVNEKKKRREYDPGVSVGYTIGPVSIGGVATAQQRAGFSWEMISDNSFKITVPGLPPGEYGIIFRLAKLGSFEYSSLFGFTVPEAVKE